MYDYLVQAPVASFIFLITLATSLQALWVDGGLLQRFMLIPARIWHRGEWYRLFTAGLIHANGFHLLFNLLTFYFFARYVEAYYLGHFQFGLVYLLSLGISSLWPAWKYRSRGDYQALGASGAVSGLLFAFILFNPTATFGVFFIIPMPAWLFAILFVLISYWLGRRGDSSIGHEAHLAGALTGFGLAALLHPEQLLRLLTTLGYLLG